MHKRKASSRLFKNETHYWYLTTVGERKIKQYLNTNCWAVFNALTVTCWSISVS